MAAPLQADRRGQTRDARADDKDPLRHMMKLARPMPGRRPRQRSNTSRVLVAVATTAPLASVTTPSVKPTRAPDLTTVPVAVSSPLREPHRLEVVDLDLDRGVALALRQCAVQRASGDRVQQRADQAAVDGADRVVRGFVGPAGEYHLAGFGGRPGRTPSVRRSGVGARMPSIIALQVVDAGHRQPARGRRRRVVPVDDLRAAFAPALLGGGSVSSAVTGSPCVRCGR